MGKSESQTEVGAVAIVLLQALAVFKFLILGARAVL
jgi:hypothetical protein